MQEFKIQYVAYKTHKSQLFKCNNMNSPDSLNDYVINIIDLSDESMWQNKGKQINSLNNLNDLKNISDMIKRAKTKILIILPQNVIYKYYYDAGEFGYDYLFSKELKNILPFLNNIMQNLGGKTDFDFLVYDRTKTLINGKKLVSDFVFKAIFKTITKSEISRLPTTIVHNNVFFTTLDFKNNDELIYDFLTFIDLNSSEEPIPDWLEKEVFLNDTELLEKKNSLKAEIEKIKIELNENDKKIASNIFYKSCLYKSGPELVDVVNVILKEILEYNYENFVDLKKEDFLIENEDVIFIGEIKGINTNVKKSNISQTATHRDEYVEEKEEIVNRKIVAILVINRERNLPVYKRNEVNSDIIKHAEKNEVLIITSEILLKILEKFKNKELNTSDIKSILLEKQRGLLKKI